MKDERSTKVLQRGGSRNTPSPAARMKPPALPHLPCSEGEILKSFNSIKPYGHCQLNRRIARTSALPSPKADPSFTAFSRVRQEAGAAGEGLGGCCTPKKLGLRGRILPGGSGAGQHEGVITVPASPGICSRMDSTQAQAAPEGEPPPLLDPPLPFPSPLLAGTRLGSSGVL